MTKAPARVVVAGLREQDSLLALGIVPVGTTEWYGKHPGAIFPWAEAALGDAPKPEVLGFIDGIQFERIAALRPDLILAVYSGLTHKDYTTLSKIAPTIAQPPGQIDWGSSWQDEILTVGRAVGKPEEAEAAARRGGGQARRGGKASIPSSRARRRPSPRPTRGSTSTARRTPARDCSSTSASRSRSRSRSIGGEDFGGQLSAEKVDLLDVGALIWFAEPGPGGEGPRKPASTAGSTSARRAATSSSRRRARCTRRPRSSASSASRCSSTSSCRSSPPPPTATPARRPS